MCRQCIPGRLSQLRAAWNRGYTVVSLYSPVGRFALIRPVNRTWAYVLCTTWVGYILIRVVHGAVTACFHLTA